MGRSHQGRSSVLLGCIFISPSHTIIIYHLVLKSIDSLGLNMFIQQLVHITVSSYMFIPPTSLKFIYYNCNCPFFFNALPLLACRCWLCLQGLTKPGIAISPPSTLLEMALPLDDQGPRPFFDVVLLVFVSQNGVCYIYICI